MNSIYKSIWSAVRGAFVVTAEAGCACGTGCVLLGLVMGGGAMNVCAAESLNVDELYVNVGEDLTYETLTVGNKLNNVGTVTAGSVSATTLENAGSLTVAGTLTVTGETVDISGGIVKTVNLAAENATVSINGSALNITKDSMTGQYGSATMKNLALTNGGTFNTEGAVSVSENAKIGEGTNLTVKTLTVTGKLTNAASWSADTVIANSFMHNGGMLTVTNTLNVKADLTVNAGTVTAHSLNFNTNTSLSELTMTGGTLEILNGNVSDEIVIRKMNLTGGILKIVNGTESESGSEGGGSESGAAVVSDETKTSVIVERGVTIGKGATFETGAAFSVDESGTFEKPLENRGTVVAKAVNAYQIVNSGSLTADSISVKGKPGQDVDGFVQEETSGLLVTDGTVTTGTLDSRSTSVKVTGGTLEVTGDLVGSIQISGSGKVKVGNVERNAVLWNEWDATVGNGATLEITGKTSYFRSISNAGTLITAGDLYTSSDFSNAGNLTVEGKLTTRGDSKITSGTVKTKDLFFDDYLFVAGGTLEVTDSAEFESSAQLRIGSNTAAGAFYAPVITNLCNPIAVVSGWNREASKAAFSIPAEAIGRGILRSGLLVGSHSELVIGANTTEKLDAALWAISQSSKARKSHAFSESGIQAALYVGQKIWIDSSGGLAVQGSFTGYEASFQVEVTPGVTVGKNSLLIVDGGLGTEAVISTIDSTLPFKMEEGAVLYVDNATASSDGVAVVSGFAFDKDEIAAVETAEGFGAVNRLLKYRTYSLDDNTLTLYFDEVEDEGGDDPGDTGGDSGSDSKKVSPIFGMLPQIGTVVMDGTAAGTLANERAQMLLARDNGMTDDEVRAEFNKIALMNAAGGTQTAAHNASSAITDTLMDHALGETPSENQTGSALWASLHGMTSRADDYRTGASRESVSYGWKSDLAGVSMGVDRTQGSVTAGLAVSVGSGSVRAAGAGKGTKNSAQYFGAHVYGSYEGETLDVAALAGMTVTRSEVTQSGYKAKPTTAALGGALQVSRGYPLGEILTVTPHIGLKYTHLTGSRFTAGGFEYRSSDVNLFEVPVGIRLTGNFETAGGTRIEPLLDLTVSRNFGGTAAGQGVGVEGVNAADTFDARVLGRRTYGVTAGLRIAGLVHSLDFGYGLKAGEGGRRDQTLKARYRCQF